MRLVINEKDYATLINIIQESQLAPAEKNIATELAKSILSHPYGGAATSGRLAFYLQKIGDSRIQYKGKNHFCFLIIDQNMKQLTEQADVNKRDGYGKTPLANAINTGKWEEFVSYANHRETDLELSDGDGWTPIYRTITAGQYKMLETLIEKGVSLNPKNKDASRPIHVAADKNDINSLTLLLKNNAKVNVLNVRGTPLLYAVIKGHTDAVKLLLEHGADPNLISDSLSPSPLWVAKNNNNEELIALLEAKGAVLLPPRQDSSHLENLIRDGNLADIENYLAENPNMTDQHGRTALIYAAWYGREDVVQSLISKTADLDVKDKTQKAALHYAVIAGHENITAALINAKANINIQDSTNYTPLHWAAQYHGRENIAKLLIDKGANHLAQDSFYWTPFHKSAEMGNLEVLKLLVAKDEATREPKQEKAINQRSVSSDGKIGNGMTPLHRACWNKRQETVDYLKSLGADETITDVTGKIAAQYA